MQTRLNISWVDRFKMNRFTRTCTDLGKFPKIAYKLLARKNSESARATLRF